MSTPLRIAFVDDEQHVLNGLRRAMASMNGEWEMSFFTSGQDLLAAMGQSGFDVVVSDMRMPQMDGAELLGRVRECSPATIRIILSGYADTEAVLRTVGPAHSYLAKPCEPQALKTALARPLALRRLFASEGARRALGAVTHLPSLPEVFLAIEREMRSPAASAKSVAAIVGRDVAMTAELLKLTNSAFFSVGARVDTPLQAIRTLGMETVQALVLRIGIFRQLASDDSHLSRLIDQVTAVSLETAAFAEAIASQEERPPAERKAAYYAGLLGQIGMLLLIDRHGRDYAALITEAEDLPEQLRREQERYGANHALMGAYLLGLWGFSEPVVEAVAYAVNPGLAGSPENPVLTALHAARGLIARPAWLVARQSEDVDIDLQYLNHIGKSGRLPLWREIIVRPAQEEP